MSGSSYVLCCIAGHISFYMNVVVQKSVYSCSGGFPEQYMLYQGYQLSKKEVGTFVLAVIQILAIILFLS